MAWLTYEAERKFFYQKSKCRYLLQSYQNTRLFNSIAKRNAKRNNIPVLIKDDGLMTNGMDEVVGEFLSYYYGLLGTEVKVNEVDVEILSHGPTVPLDCLEELARIPMDVEIKKALFGIGRDKAPGPNGYTSGFFKTSWEIAGEDVCKACGNSFFWVVVCGNSIILSSPLSSSPLMLPMLVTIGPLHYVIWCIRSS